jgi:hypothetical protein
MSWFSKKTSQDFGEYLPDDEATLQEINVPIQAKNQKQADKTCEEEAKKYDGFDSKAQPVDGSDKDYDCRFKFWG